MRFIYSLFIPLIYKSKIKKFDVIHQHQLLGSWVALIIKLFFKKPILIRTGYDMYEFSILNKNNIFRKYFLYLLTKISLNGDIYTVASDSDYQFLKKNFNL